MQQQGQWRDTTSNFSNYKQRWPIRRRSKRNWQRKRKPYNKAQQPQGYNNTSNTTPISRSWQCARQQQLQHQQQQQQQQQQIRGANHTQPGNSNSSGGLSSSNSN